MRLHFLDFDYSEDMEATSTWDAVASVPASRLPQLLGEVSALLAWAHAQFGPLRGPVESGGLWDYDLQCEREGQPLAAMHYDPESGQLLPAPQPEPDERVSVTLSLAGGPAFAQAFNAEFTPES